MAELWRPVVGYQGSYEVSDRGRVRSAPRVVARKNGRLHPWPGQILAPTIDTNGYAVVTLGTRKNGKRRRAKICVLVLESFVGLRPFPKAHARHLDDNQNNNRAMNLAWGSNSDNLNDMVRNGHHFHAKRSKCVRDHEFTPENTKYRGKTRICRECERERSRDYKQRQREKKGQL